MNQTQPNPNAASNPGQAQQGNSDVWLIMLHLIMLVASGFMIVQGAMIFRASEFWSGELLGLGILGAIVTAASYTIATSSGSKPAAGTDAQTDRLLAVIADRLLISDTAKRILYRERDREALRKAIREDLDNRDYEAALVLVNQMSEVYGYRIEAEGFRSEIEHARETEVQERIAESIRNIDHMIQRHEFDKALREAKMVSRVFEDHDEVKDLRKHVLDARERHKHELERKFLAAAERDDIEVAMELLKEMDKYLTEAEAAPFQETARGVIGKKRSNLGVQFKLAVHDKDWTQAVRVGEQIIREFPNSKMAVEVRGMLDVLRQRAAGQMAVQPT